MNPNPQSEMSRKPRRRLYFLLATLVIVCFGTWFYFRYRVARPIGAGPAGPTVSASEFQSIWTERRVHVIGLGDSVTAGLGAANPSHSYFNRILKNPDDEYDAMKGICLSAVVPNLTHENFAQSGTESKTHLDVIGNQIPEFDEEVYGIIFMTTGGNDLIHMYGQSPPRECAMYGATKLEAEPWIENFEVRLRSMLSQLAEKFPGGCEIYLADIYDPTDGVGDAPSIFLPDWPDGLAIHAEYNQKIRIVASEFGFVHVVDLYETFLGHGSHCRQFWQPHYDPEDPYYWYFTNVEDPNDRGYDAVRRVFLNTIAANTQLRDN